MSFIKTDEGKYNWLNIVCALIGICTLLSIFAIVIFHTPEETKAPAVVDCSQTNVINYNYYKIDGKESPLDLLGCKMLEISAGGYALVCPKK